MIANDSWGGHSLSSPCGQYRYWYHLRLSDSPRTCCFIMLNPARKSENEQPKRPGTLKKCIGFAKDLDFGTLRTCNLFAFRSRNPKALLDTSDPVGPENDRYIADVVERTDMIVCAWGDGPRGLRERVVDRAHSVAAILRTANTDGRLYGLGSTLTKRGQPRHPGRISMSQHFPLWIQGNELRENTLE